MRGQSSDLFTPLRSERPPLTDPEEAMKRPGVPANDQHVSAFYNPGGPAGESRAARDPFRYIRWTAFRCSARE